MSQMVLAESRAESAANPRADGKSEQSKASRARRWLGILLLVAISVLHAAVVLVWTWSRL